MIQEEEKNKKKLLLAVSAILLGFVLPILVIAVGINIFRVTNNNLKEKNTENSPEITSEEVIKPSALLNNRSAYNNKRVVVRGRVTREPAVCEKKECPVEDSCCGCPGERNLILADSDTVLTSKNTGRLRLLGQQKESLCKRKPDSCEYECRGWTEGAIYDVTGKFFTETPPPGWKVSLDYYFLVESKSLVRKVGIMDTIGNLFNEIKAQFQKLKTSGSYVL